MSLRMPQAEGAGRPGDDHLGDIEFSAPTTRHRPGRERDQRVVVRIDATPDVGAHRVGHLGVDDGGILRRAPVVETELPRPS
jgi:hypothetical protein